MSGFVWSTLGMASPRRRGSRGRSARSVTRAGGVAGLFNTCHEDTQQVLAERERDRLAAQRQLALDAARMGWWHYDPATKLATFDERYAEIFGVTGNQRPNEEILGRLHPDDLPGMWAKVEAALDPADPKPYSAEYRIIRDDGSVRWVEAHGTATFEGDGGDRRATSFVGTVADITERKRVAEQSRTILESISDAFFALDREWRFTYLNPQAERMLGRSPGDLIGRVIWDEYRIGGTEFERAYRRAATERVAVSFTSFYPDHDRWYEVNAYPAPEGISVYFRDVSERKRVERRWRRARSGYGSSCPTSRTTPSSHSTSTARSRRGTSARSAYSATRPRRWSGGTPPRCSRPRTGP